MNKVHVSRRLALIGLCLLPTTGWAGGVVQISDAWTRPTPGQSASAAVYLTVSSGEADTVIGVSTPVAASASLHVHRRVNGVGQMLPIERVEIAAATPFRFAPMGYHIMLTGLKAPLKPDDHFPLTLRFAKTGSVTVAVAVRPLRESAPAAAMPAMPGMDSMPGMTNMDMAK